MKIMHLQVRAINKSIIKQSNDMKPKDQNPYLPNRYAEV